MKDHRLVFEPELSGLAPEDWTARLSEIADDLGYFEPLGKAHSAYFLDAGPQLLVTFENAETVRKTAPDASPRGFRFVRNKGWSHLALLSDTESWFRDITVYRYFDRLIDDGFFEDFENVVFYGAHAAGYAAAAFSVAAPGATLLALRPQATLDPRIAGWDSRYKAQRRLSFSDRYGYAPDMIDAVDHAYIAFDPYQRFDAMHAGMFTRANVTPLPCPGLGWKLDQAFDAMGIHDDFLRAAMDGTLSTELFHDLMRARRSYAPYLRSVYAKMLADGHPTLAAAVCRHAIAETDDTFFESKLQDLIDQGHVTSPKSRKSAT